jgi:hypothetical protein
LLSHELPEAVLTISRFVNEAIVGEGAQAADEEDVVVVTYYCTKDKRCSTQTTILDVG